MKAKTIGGLIAGLALSAATPTSWGAGHGGGGGSRGGGFGAGGFHGGGFSHAFAGGPRFGPPVRSLAVPLGRPMLSTVGNPDFRASGVNGMHRTGTNIPNVRRQPVHGSTIATRSRALAPAAAARATSPRVNSAQAGSSKAVARESAPRGFTGRIAERHPAMSWHGNWDRRRLHFDHDRFFVFDDGFWWGLDEGEYPWDYYPYYTYDYYPYDYYVGAPDNVPADYQGTTAVAPAPDATVTNVQTQLTQLGYYSGPIDGLFGPTTRDALVSYQTSQGLTVTGSLSPDTLQSLGLPSQVAAN